MQLQLPLDILRRALFAYGAVKGAKGRWPFGAIGMLGEDRPSALLNVYEPIQLRLPFSQHICALGGRIHSIYVSQKECSYELLQANMTLDMTWGRTILIVPTSGQTTVVFENLQVASRSLVSNDVPVDEAGMPKSNVAWYEAAPVPLNPFVDILPKNILRERKVAQAILESLPRFLMFDEHGFCTMALQKHVPSARCLDLRNVVGSALLSVSVFFLCLIALRRQNLQNLQPVDEVGGALLESLLSSFRRDSPPAPPPPCSPPKRQKKKKLPAEKLPAEEPPAKEPPAKEPPVEEPEALGQKQGGKPDDKSPTGPSDEQTTGSVSVDTGGATPNVEMTRNLEEARARLVVLDATVFEQHHRMFQMTTQNAELLTRVGELERQRADSSIALDRMGTNIFRMAALMAQVQFYMSREHLVTSGHFTLGRLDAQGYISIHELFQFPAMRQFADVAVSDALQLLGYSAVVEVTGDSVRPKDWYQLLKHRSAVSSDA